MNALPARLLTLPIAHRGLHDVTKGRPENSRAAIRAAIDANYAIEIDIQMSRDGQAIVFHDYFMHRLTAEFGAVRQRSAADLCQTKLTGSDETIPSLAEILDLVAGRAPLLIEIKDQDGAMGPDTGPLEKMVANELHNYQGQVAVMSFNPHSVAWMKDLLPDTPRGLITGAFLKKNWGILPESVRDRLREIPDFDRVQANFISHKACDLERPRVVELKAAGVPILCWTLKDEASELLAREFADNITFEDYLPKHLPA